MFRLVFWWLTCVAVLFSFSYLFVLYLRFFECFSILIFAYCVYLLILSMHNQYPPLAFKVCLHSRLCLFNYTFAAFVFGYAVPQFAYSNISCSVLLN